MKEIIFKGEHLLSGNFGHILVVLAFMSSLASAFFYYINTKNNTKFTKNHARFFWAVQSVSVIGIFAVIFYQIFNHYYEYQYVWDHSSNTLPIYYMISAFWEGQEGSFLLWMVWHVVLSAFLLKSSREWESYVMPVVMLVQATLLTMLLGVNVFGVKIGLSPFELLRDVQANILDVPVLQKLGKENYLQIIKDGNGLNPLLQNYWMVIHPPTLFLGFAALTIPFSYAIAGAWRGMYKEWINPCLPWVLFAVMILGLGIVMGAYWAFIALSFGGYWAWDPVENASLMPWLLSIAALHVLLITKNLKKYVALSYSLVVMSFILVLYATFLTRSGILGESSVHSFVDLGLSGQLIFLMFIFVFISIFVTIKNTKNKLFFLGSIVFIYAFYLINSVDKVQFVSPSIPISLGILFTFGGLIWSGFNIWKIEKNNTEETVMSREFWMFIGVLILLLSLIQIIVGTSMPVLGSITGIKKAPPRPEDYTMIQMYITIPILLLMGVSRFFFFKGILTKNISNALIYSLLGALVLTTISTFVFKIIAFKYLAFIFAVSFAMIANIYYAIKKRKKLLSWGASLAHAGFALMLLGTLVSSVNKNVISYNNTKGDYVKSKDDATKSFNKENIYMKKHQPVRMKNFIATYSGWEQKGIDKYFTVDFQRLNKKGDTVENFTLHPNAQNNPKMGLLANPDLKHYFSADLYAFIGYESTMDQDDEQPEITGHKLDTVFINDQWHTTSTNISLTLDSMVIFKGKNNNFKFRTYLTVIRPPEVYQTQTDISFDGKKFVSEPIIMKEVGLVLKLNTFSPNQVDPTKHKFTFYTSEFKPKAEFIVMKAILFPYVSLLWIGSIIMVIGSGLAMVNRRKKLKNK